MSNLPGANFFSNLPQPKKRVFVIFSFLTVAFIIFLAWFFHQAVSSPFYINPKDVTIGNFLASSTSPQQYAIGMNPNDKKTDTDGDGLSDWDEVHIYHTSPYLADTDGDGIPDGVEVKNGTDPNCPQGQTCAGFGQGFIVNNQTPTTSSTSSSLSSSSAPTAVSFGAVPSLNINNLDQNQLLAIYNGQGTASSVRAILIAAGANQADLNKISDAALLASYQSVLSEQNPGALSATSTATTTSSSLNQ
jgi:hypothetical protein